MIRMRIAGSCAEVLEREHDCYVNRDAGPASKSSGASGCELENRPRCFGFLHVCGNASVGLCGDPAEQAQSMMAKGDLQGSLKVFDDYLEAAPQDADTLRLARLGSHSELFG